MKKKIVLVAGVIFSLFQLNSCGGAFEGSASSDQNAVYYEEGEMTEAYVMESKDEVDIELNTEEYAYLPENEFMSPGLNPLSTFSIDVDNASYTNVRRMINMGQVPSVDAVRTEEFVNYFEYDYPTPLKKDVFSVYTELGDCPWNDEAKLLHIGLKGYTVPIEELPPSNLVFLIDVSGSMEDDTKLPLLKKSFKLMVDRLNTKDRVSIVTYAGSERLVLPSTSCDNKEMIYEAIDDLESGGSTNGEGGIEMAYEQALNHYLPSGNNRVILATDGDFNVGKSSGGDLTRLIEEKRDAGVYLTVLGFGMGNYKDATMESMADHGNGNYFYIDDIRESNRVLVNNLAGTLLAIAKDVKIQVEFNPEMVKSYRLIGYENRMMNAEDFEDDKKDAGELGAGHTVTAIYEIIPGKAEANNLKYQQSNGKGSDEWAFIKLRYKLPNEDESILKSIAVKGKASSWMSTSNSFRFSAAVAGFSMLLRESKFCGDLSFDQVIEIAKESTNISQSDRLEFIRLVEDAKDLIE